MTSDFFGFQLLIVLVYSIQFQSVPVFHFSKAKFIRKVDVLSELRPTHQVIELDDDRVYYLTHLAFN
jgi:hypothetical protein